MASALHLYVSHGSYRAQYDHLNQQEFVGKVKALAPKSYTTADNYDVIRVLKQQIVLPRSLAHLPTKTLKLALASTYAKDCSCEHDCCGHYFGGLRELKRKGRNLFATCYYSRNI